MILFPRDFLRQMFADICGIQCIFAGDAEPFQWASNGTAQTEGLVKLTVENWESVGIDETRYTYDSGTDQNNSAQYGVRKFKLGVRVEIPGSSNFTAIDVLEIARTRLRRQVIQQQYPAAGISLAMTGPVASIKAEFDNQQIYCAYMAVDFNIYQYDDQSAVPSPTYQRAFVPTPVAPGPEDTGYIATVNTNNRVPGTFSS